MYPQSSQQCFQQCHGLLSKQAEQISHYIEYLDAIKDAIAKNLITELDELLASNTSRIAPIEQLQQQQSQFLIAQGFSDDEQGLKDCIRACDQERQLEQLGQALTEQLNRLQQSLLINNLLIQKNQQRVRQSIRILSGHGPSQQPATYSRLGQKSSDLEALHSLAKA